ncbi:hypothetical protein LPJ72_003531 [Coemansia sp. Benny D160-2]|nr:hypothetical protein LPJ72_003531 [Coemansia sp. Benny D160-2]
MVLRNQNGNLSTVFVGAPVDTSDTQASLRSPTDPSLVAVLRSMSGSRRVVEVWRNSTLNKCIDVTDTHGDFYSDSVFGSLSWSNDNRSIVYSAERPEYSKAGPDGGARDGRVEDHGGDITDDIIGSVGGVADPRLYKAESDWGETFSGKRPPVLVVVDISSMDVRVLSSPAGITPGQVQFLPDKSSSRARIVFTGYKHSVRKYGIAYCQNRPSGIYIAELGSEDYECIYSGAVRSPRVTPSGKGVVFLSTMLGSLGFGQDAVLAQIGNMDTLTIDEIQEAASLIHSKNEGDAEATVYLGGSYSGYTGALLAGLVPGFYRGIVLRNPVISIGENAAISDIPDWCWAELGLEYDFDAPSELTPNAFSQMWKASPSRLVDKVRDPLLLLLGAQDRRVPPAQSLSYYYRLKAANAPVQCKIYPGVGHPLNSVEAERDSFVSIGRFYASAFRK